MRHRFLYPLLLASTFLAGCVSTQERYDKGTGLQSRGRHAEAAAAYIKVLRKEPGRAEARARLHEAGAQAAALYLQEAEAHEAARQYARAVTALNRLDALRRGAADVGVRLDVPEDYDRYRQRLTDAAIAALIADGERAEAAGRWQQALDAYEGVKRTYRPAPALAAEMDAARARVYVRWSEAELQARRFRAAYDRAGQALALAGTRSPLTGHALRLRDDALAAGTRVVALLPSVPAEAAGRAVPRGLLASLDDALLDLYWTDPPPFLEAADPAALRRVLRRLRYDRTPLTRSEAADAGREVDADLVVTSDMLRFERLETVLQAERRAARTRGRAARDTAYVRHRLTLRLAAAVHYRLVDPRTRALLHEETVHADAATHLERAVYAGDPHTLQLTAAEARLFDAEQLHQAERDLEDALVEQLAERLGDAMQPVLLRQVR